MPSYKHWTQDIAELLRDTGFCVAELTGDPWGPVLRCWRPDFAFTWVTPDNDTVKTSFPEVRADFTTEYLEALPPRDTNRWRAEALLQLWPTLDRYFGQPVDTMREARNAALERAGKLDADDAEDQRLRAGGFAAMDREIARLMVPRPKAE